MRHFLFSTDKQMKNTVIFDLFQVLIDWQPDPFYTSVISDKNRLAYFLNEVMHKDFGLFTDGVPVLKPVLSLLKEKHPDFSKELDMYIDNEYKMINVIDGTVDIAKELKSKGIKLYMLSNISIESVPWLKSEPFFPLFDGAILSGEIDVAKPDPRIFQYLFDKYNVRPEDAVFIDDRLENTKAAEEAGLSSILFTNPENLKKELTRYNLLP